MDTQNPETQTNTVSEVGNNSDSQSEGLRSNEALPPPLGPSAFYHRGHKAPPSSQITKPDQLYELETRPLLARYSGENYLPVIPPRNDIVAEDDEGSTAILEHELTEGEDIPFMPI